MEIKPYHPDYLEGVLRAWESASQVGHPFLSENFLQTERSNIPSVYLPNGETWLALINESVAGFTILHGNEVGALFVSSEFHGHGIGFALMNKANELHAQLKLEVFKDNTIAKNFYFRYGFTLVREYFHEQSGMMMLCLEYGHN